MKIPKKEEIKKVFNSLSKGRYYLLVFFICLSCISFLAILKKISNEISIEIPSYGGEIIEGVIGSPRFVNPLLQLSDADKDLTFLIFSGLMKKNENNELISDLASHYQVSEDGLVYTFTLRKNLFFHDGQPLTADDVIFTYEKVKDSLINSPQKNLWSGVKIEKINDRKVKFVLEKIFPNFLENTTLGILPYHLWKDVPSAQWSLSSYNIKAVGAGPYKIKKIREKGGLPYIYELEAFKKYHLKKPYISKIILKFYSNEEDALKALENSEINQIASLSPENVFKISKEKKYFLQTISMPRLFGLFFNSSHNLIFTDKEVIKAFEKVIDKEKIINEVLFGFGEAINSPVPLLFLNHYKNDLLSSFNESKEISESSEPNLKEAIDILEKAGWKVDENGERYKEKISSIYEKLKGKRVLKEKKEITKLAFSISTNDVPELRKAVELIKSDLEKLGARVELKIYDSSDLNQKVIRSRDYDVLFFGQVINNETDLFAFWHSSQRFDPGLNIAMYANSKVDELLENILTESNYEKKSKYILEFEKRIKEDKPALFIYSPKFIYIFKKPVFNVKLSNIKNSQERFLNIQDWHIKTDFVWKIF